MPDIESHPRLLELIGLAKDAATLHQQMKARNEATTQVDEAIGAIYSDIGRLVYRLMSQGSRAESADTAEGSDDDRATFLPFTEEATQSTVPTEEEVAERMNWYTDEVEVDDAEPLFTKEDRLDELTDIPESDPISEEVEMDTVTDHEDYEVTTIAQLRRNSGASDHPLRRLSDESSDPTWAYKLTQLLNLLELPIAHNVTKWLSRPLGCSGPLRSSTRVSTAFPSRFRCASSECSPPAPSTCVCNLPSMSDRGSPWTACDDTVSTRNSRLLRGCLPNQVRRMTPGPMTFRPGGTCCTPSEKPLRWTRE